MKYALEAAGRTFIQAFASALFVYGLGVLKAPDLQHTYLIAVAAIIASIAFGIAALLNWINSKPSPYLTFVRWFGHPLGDWLDAFTLAFLSTLVVTLPGVLGAPDFGTLKAVIVGAITGAVAAGVRAAVGLLTPGEKPAANAKAVPPPTVSIG